MGVAKNRLSVDDVKAALDDKLGDFDPDEFDDHFDDYRDRFADVQDDGFVAYAVAKKEYGVTVDSVYTTRGGGGGGGGGDTDVEDLPTYSLRKLKDPETRPKVGHGEEEETENFNIKGYVVDKWSGIKEGNPRRNIVLRDPTEKQWVMVTGAQNREDIEAFDRAALEIGDYIKLGNVRLFVPEDDPDFQLVFANQFSEYERTEPEFDFDDVAEVYGQDPLQEEDFAKVDGYIGECETNGYEGCSICKTSYDPEEKSLCPSCGSEGTRTWYFTTIQMSPYDADPIEVSLTPGKPFNAEDDEIILCEGTFYGTYEMKEDQNEETYPAIDVEAYEIELEDGSTVTIQDTDRLERDGETDVESGSKTPEEIVEESEESYDEETAEEAVEENADDDSDGDGEHTEIVEDLEQRVENMDYEAPGSALLTVLNNKYNIEKSEGETIEEIFRELKSRENVNVDGDEQIAEHQWKKVFLSS